MFKRRDKRIKGCWNPKCIRHKKHFKYKSDDVYCPKCRSELVYVCKRCGGLLEDEGRKHRVCNNCIERQKANAEKRKEALSSSLSALAKVLNIVADVVKKRRG